MRANTAILISLFVAAALSFAGCGKGEKDNKKAAPAPETKAKPDKPVDPEAAKKKAEEEKERQERIARIAERIKQFEADAAEAKKRWTDELEAEVTALTGKEFKDGKAALKAILASKHRTPGESGSDRDKYRHPAETLAFFEVEPHMFLVEVGAGGGWYTEILAPLVARSGRLIVPMFDPKGPPDNFRTAYGRRFELTLANAPALFGKVETVIIDPPDKLGLGGEDTADRAFAFREMHNWHRSGYLDKYVAEVFRVLKPGGMFGVVQHRAKPDANPDESAEKGYLPEKWLIDTIVKAGFEFVEKSEINANPKDTKDYEKGVWTLPPGFANKDVDRDKYAAIGESDRMTLKFRKPTREK